MILEDTNRLQPQIFIYLTVHTLSVIYKTFEAWIYPIIQKSIMQPKTKIDIIFHRPPFGMVYIGEIFTVGSSGLRL